ncbi:hypothetical protein BVC80_9075g10 [Macleaya cordata]|uniref:Sodium channel modifier 1 n=1 Tax=Macleaya cordata TaxID=56857 RepID=A0A200PU78_MACCD|nr:hypothetical protein BVC80_9075g10 [Macleaya cordata]
MSVFGGDSWGREAQFRKRRVDDLIVDGLDTCSYKKLSNGKYACLLCPNNPVFDSSLMLSMHNKGSRHVAVVSRLKEKELMQQEEIKKRIALSDDSDGSVGTASFGTFNQQHELKSKKPLIEWTRKVTSEALKTQRPERNLRNEQHSAKPSNATTYFSSISSSVPIQRTGSSLEVKSGSSTFNEKNNGWETEEARKMLVEHQSEPLKRREKELKFTAAGWKRDCHGKWFKDENVEFDSDEEDPNVCLA